MAEIKVDEDYFDNLQHSSMLLEELHRHGLHKWENYPKAVKTYEQRVAEINAYDPFAGLTGND